MKKTRFLVLALVVSVMLLGAGYAAWTDTLHITDTINTGHLDVHFVDLPGESELTLSEYESGYVRYSRDSEGGQNDWDTATAVINNVYPGGKFSIRYRMQNNSTMPVEIASLDFGKWSDWVDAAGGTVGGPEGISSGIGKLEFIDKDGKTVLKTVNPFSIGQMVEGEIPVGGYIELYVNFSAIDYEEDDTITVTMTPTFKQFNK